MATETLLPSSEAELSDMIASAKEPLSIHGGGTQGVTVAGQPLSTNSLTGITLYDPGALTIVAKAGTPLSQIEAALTAENQMLAFEPMDYRTLLGTVGEPTIGGVVATNTSGPRRFQAGACRDYLLGVRFVDGAGTIVKNGGRVMKNVTGYDLSRLMCGAYGTLGVLSEVSLKVLPKPETQVTLAIQGLGAATSIDAMSVATGSPFEVTGAALVPGAPNSPTYFRLEGFGASVEYRAAELTKRLDRFGEVIPVSDPAASAQIWQEIRDVAAFKDKSGVTCVSLKPSDFPGLEASLDNCEVLLDHAGGLVWVASDDGQEDKPGLHQTLQDFSARHGGHSRKVKGSLSEGETRFQPEAEPLNQMARALRGKFDPKGILNSGLMG